MSPAPLLCVCLKPAWRHDVHLRLDEAGRALRSEEALAAPDPAALSALGLALELRAALGAGARVLALSVAPPRAVEPLREALAAGADEALRVWPPGWSDDPGALDATAGATQARARAVAQVLRPRSPLLVLAGERSADSGHESFGASLAAALGATFAHRVTAVTPEGAGWRATVRLERGYGQELELPAPAVLTVSDRLARPAPAALPAWLAARQAEIPLAAPDVPAPAPEPTRLRVPVPRVKRYRVPPPGLSAEERIRALVTLETQAGGQVLADAPPERQAEAVLEFLRQRGCL